MKCNKGVIYLKNLLPNSTDTEEYEKWMKSKPLHFLKCVLSNYNIDLKTGGKRYTNLPTRIDLITNEIKRREQLNIRDTDAQHDSVVDGIKYVCEALIQD